MILPLMRHILIIFICAFALCLSVQVLAGGANYWRMSKQGDFLRGISKGISIAENGNLTLASNLKEIFDTQQMYIWSGAVDSKGNIYIGTGHDGKLYKVGVDGKGILWFDFDELEVSSISTDKFDNVFAATSPDGKVYKITPNGKKETFFDPVDKYIWTLLLRSDGTLFVGTGPNGIVYQVDSSGKSEILIDTTELNIMTLELDKQGRLLLGTDPNGLILRVEKPGRVFALFDAPLREIHRIIYDSSKDVIYALGISDKTVINNVSSNSSVQPSVSVSISNEDGPDATLPTIISSSKADNNTPLASSIYQLTNDGDQDVLWTSNDITCLDFSLLPNGCILFGTINPGRLFTLTLNKKISLVIESGEDSLSRLISSKNKNGEMYILSSNRGKLFKLFEDGSKVGLYTSPVQDTKVASQWGNIFWRADGDVTLQTRSGNTETPDITWSDWSSEYRNNNHKISSPKSRFLQWRASFKQGALLQSVDIAYLPKNLAPQVISLTLLSPGILLQDPIQQPVDSIITNLGLDPSIFGFPVGIPPRRTFQKGARSIQWQAEDGNNDQLTYSIFYKILGAKEWHLLSSEIFNSYYAINIDTLADGVYYFKIEATDKFSNPSDLSLTGSRTSEPIEIDNTSPEINFVNPSYTKNTITVSVNIIDKTSLLHRVEYSLDNSSWNLIYPNDGIVDDYKENFSLKLPITDQKEHTLAIRAYDASSNVGVQKILLRN